MTAPGLDHVLVCGLGSIGRRHLRHLRALGVARVDAWRTGRATPPDQGQPEPDRIFRDLGAALAERPQAVIVANPTSLHLETALAAVRAGCHVLVEKPLAASLAGTETLKAELARQRTTFAVGCNLRFHPLLLQARDQLRAGALGPVHGARIHFHAYLPAWHPWEDYRGSYAARRDLGGGAALTHIHEIDYALWLFGPAANACGRTAPSRPLGTDVDERTALLIQHESGVLTELSLSLCTRPPSRGFEVSAQAGTLRGDLLANRWHLLRSDGSREEGGVPADFDLDQTYRAQLEHFVGAASGVLDRPAVNLEEGLAALRIALCPGEPL